jgi:hypothetical protein
MAFSLHSLKTGSMGFFSKLFGSGKNDFIPSADLMPEDKFWGLIAASRSESGGDSEGQESALTALLHELPLNDLITFQNRYRQLRGQAYTWPLWGAVYIINGGCSDDGFCYFRDWLITQGREVYTNTLADPEWLADFKFPEEETNLDGDIISSKAIFAEEMAYVADSVFEKRTGQHLPAEFAENNEITGPEWKEEGDDLARMFPKLWKECNGCE